MLLHPQFDPVAFSLGPLSVRWYGLMYLVAFVQFILLGRYRIRTRPGLMTVEQLDDLLFYGMLGVIVGGRLGQVLFYEPGYYLANPLEILAVWKGGMSFHGGFLGVLIAMGLWSRKHSVAWFDVTDFIAPLVPLGLAAGRIGNFINGELWGRVADPSLPWAMMFPQSGDMQPRQRARKASGAPAGTIASSSVSSERNASSRTRTVASCSVHKVWPMSPTTNSRRSLATPVKPLCS